MHALYLSNIYMGIFLGHFIGALTPLWSLAIEEQFYLIVAPTLLLISSKKHWNLIVAAFIITATLQIILRAQLVNSVFVYTFSINNFAVMLAGGIAYFFRANLQNSSANSKLALLTIIGTLAIATFRAKILGNALSPLLQGILDVIEMIACAGMVLWIANNQKSTTVRLLELKYIEYLGSISYGFYLIHNIIPPIGESHTLMKIFGYSEGPISEVVSITFEFTMAVTLAHLSWKYIERPITALKDKKPAAPATKILNEEVRF